MNDATPAPEDSHLTPYDLHRMELAQERMTSAQLRIDVKVAEGERDAARVQAEQHAATARLLQLALDGHRRDKEIEKLRTVYVDRGRAYEALKEELAPIYDIADWKTVTYDDETGRLQRLPDPSTTTKE